MIYELRIYHSMPGRLPALLSRFEKHTLRIWEKHGIRQAGFWTTLIGESESRLTYLLAWDSMAERQERWSAFLTDPEWIAIKSETEKDGQLVQNISNELLAPTAFSGREVRDGASYRARPRSIRPVDSSPPSQLNNADRQYLTSVDSASVCKRNLGTTSRCCKRFLQSALTIMLKAG
jgi:hypothetical protein